MIEPSFLQSQLGALCLPRLTQAYVMSVRLESRSRRIDLWADFFHFVAALPIFFRFVKEYPKESSEAMVAYMGRWVGAFSLKGSDQQRELAASSSLP